MFCAFVSLWFVPVFLQAQPERIRAVSEAVILDLVVRDGRGRPVRDLRPDEIEVFEDGSAQQIRSLRFVGEERLATTAKEKSAQPAAIVDRGARVDLLRHINLITLVFERLGNEARQLSRQAALDLVNREIGQNTLIAVFAVDRRLYALQQFTRDRAALREAIDRVTSGAHAKFRSQSEAVRRELERVRGHLAGAEAIVTDANPDGSPTDQARLAASEIVLARLTLEALQTAETLERDQQGHASLDSLLALVGEQRRLAGRKTVIFFSEGLLIQPKLVDRFRFLISQANLANVSVYPVDARGLITTGLSASSREVLDQAATASARQMQAGRGSVSREDVMIGESAEESLRMNVQVTLDDLASSTGGFLIANTNDARPGMRLVQEDISSHYELVYEPRKIEYDGKFRAISVKVSRPDVRVRTRSGYFALAPGAGPTVPYEIPLLAALGASSTAHDFAHHTRALRFGRQADRIHYTLVMEVPLGNFLFAEDMRTSTYGTHFSLMSLLKDAQGRVLEKFSQDYPLSGPLEKLATLKNGAVVFMRQFRIQPGRYTLETAAVDQRTQKISAVRDSLQVSEPQPGVQISSLSVIRRADPLGPGEAQSNNPLRYQNVKIVPNLAEPIQQGRGAQLGLHCVIYPSALATVKPRITLVVVKGGQVVARGTPELPSADGEGRIPFVVTLPLTGFASGTYEVRALVEQGQSSAEERVSFIIK